MSELEDIILDYADDYGKWENERVTKWAHVEVALAEHEAEVVAKAWDEGALAQEHWITNPNYEVEDNPYRKEVQS